MIASVDEFIHYDDDMQYTRRDCRNRNQIKTPQKEEPWLTVPMQAKGKHHQKINDTEIDGADWALIHGKVLVPNYHRAPHFDEIARWFHLRSEELVSGSTTPSIHISVLARVDKHE